MAHEIWGNRFAAVRVPAWHGLGTVYQEDVLPSKVAVETGLLYEVQKFPLYIQGEAGPVDTGLVLVGRIEDDAVINYGTAKSFDVVMLSEILDRLDGIAEKFPLSAAGALRQGAEVFFTFTVSASSEIAGEEYAEYITVAHSYTPGVAHRFIYSPVRTVCQNTLILGEKKATGKVSVQHNSRSIDRLNAGYIVVEAMARAGEVKRQLEQLAKIQVHDEDAILDEVYGRYKSTNKLDTLVYDMVDDEATKSLFDRGNRQDNYVKGLKDKALAAYATLNDEYPRTAGTAYNLLQAVVEVADWRNGRSARGTAESAVVGVRAAEKKVAWEILTSLN